MMWDWLDERPIIVAVAGPNGAGKTTFFHSHLASAGLRFVNADFLAKQLAMDAYAAAAVAETVRRELVRQRESFVFETVFSDPAGDKLNFLKEAARAGYTVVLCFIGLSNVSISDERVAMRVAQGGHDVPIEKLAARFPRTLLNLKQAIVELPQVIVYDNSDLGAPYQRIAIFSAGQIVEMSDSPPLWLTQCLPAC